MKRLAQKLESRQARIVWFTLVFCGCIFLPRPSLAWHFHERRPMKASDPPKQAESFIPNNQEPVENEDFGYTMEVSLVDLFVTVLDPERKVVRDLKKEDFLLWEDNREQEVFHFSTFEEAPLSLAVLLDTSGSMGYSNKLGNSLAIIEAITRSLDPQDEMALFTFSDFFVKTRVSFTNDKDAVLKKMKDLHPQGKTALYQAISFLPGVIGEPRNRQAVILLTDGLDNMSVITMTDMLATIRTMLIPIYTLSFTCRGSSYAGQEDETVSTSILKKISEETGGTYIELASKDDLPNAIQTIMPELRYQYLLGYYSNQNPRPGTYHTIRIETQKKENLVKARKGYAVPE